MDKGNLFIRLKRIEGLLIAWLIRSFGVVFTARFEGQPFPVSIKRVDLKRQPKQELIINEIMAMKELRHKNIVTYISSYIWKEDLSVIMEYMDGGCLTDIIMYGLMQDKHIAVVCKEAVAGLCYLHANGIIHRDIKADNILLNMNGNVKIGKYLVWRGNMEGKKLKLTQIFFSL